MSLCVLSVLPPNTFRDVVNDAVALGLGAETVVSEELELSVPFMACSALPRFTTKLSVSNLLTSTSLTLRAKFSSVKMVFSEPFNSTKSLNSPRLFKILHEDSTE